jgi:hypothetical protein
VVAENGAVIGAVGASGAGARRCVVDEGVERRHGRRGAVIVAVARTDDREAWGDRRLRTDCQVAATAAS